MVQSLCYKSGDAGSGSHYKKSCVLCTEIQNQSHMVHRREGAPFALGKPQNLRAPFQSLVIQQEWWLCQATKYAMVESSMFEDMSSISFLQAPSLGQISDVNQRRIQLSKDSAQMKCWSNKPKRVHVQ